MCQKSVTYYLNSWRRFTQFENVGPLFLFVPIFISFPLMVTSDRINVYLLFIVFHLTAILKSCVRYKTHNNFCKHFRIIVLKVGSFFDELIGLWNLKCWPLIKVVPVQSIWWFCFKFDLFAQNFSSRRQS